MTGRMRTLYEKRTCPGHNTTSKSTMGAPQASYLEHRTAQYSTPCGHKLARAQQPAGNRLGVNELIEAPGAAPETQALLASLAQPEHTESPTKTALMPLPGSNGP
ncbi:hypothetical protein Q7C36_009058 [Tachysurus vachellii]|uniref:Uncharacterized protein n=1 Tax=Tachysurus vachellii TaxID=175792 RepID=A0AA88SU92_TACVA|nr:hypothetical protein Q7C36_009058 [Tachysurus vachellii]